MTATFLTTAMVAERFNVRPETVTRWVLAGNLTAADKLPGKRGVRLFTIAEVERFAAERAAKAEDGAA